MDQTLTIGRLANAAKARVEIIHYYQGLSLDRMAEQLRRMNRRLDGLRDDLTGEEICFAKLGFLASAS